jgi:hypothetical protein
MGNIDFSHPSIFIIFFQRCVIPNKLESKNSDMFGLCPLCALQKFGHDQSSMAMT